MMTFAIISGLVYAAYGIDYSLIFWRDWDVLRRLLALINIVTGLVVATYPGVLLGRHKGRPFWVGPGIMGLFLLSSLVTALAAHQLWQHDYAGGRFGFDGAAATAGRAAACPVSAVGGLPLDQENRNHPS